MFGYKNVLVDDIRVYYKSKNVKTFELICSSLNTSVKYITQDWCLTIPNDISIYVMNSWRGFLTKSTPKKHWPFLGFYMMILTSKMNKLWPAMGSWSRNANGEFIIGIKDINIIQNKHKDFYLNNKTQNIFYAPTSIEETIIHLVTHELISISLNNSPQWLIEGITLNVLEKILGKPKVQESTINKLQEYTVESLARDQLANYLVGYYFVKYLIEAKKEIIIEQLESKEVSVEKLLNFLSFAGFKAKVLEYFGNES